MKNPIINCSFYLHFISKYEEDMFAFVLVVQRLIWLILDFTTKDDLKTILFIPNSL